jgi:NDP-sugar pyrophosphorylase family protein
MEIKHTILMDDTTVHSGFIGDSVIGRNCKIGANITVGNVRLDRKKIKARVNGTDVDTGQSSLGMTLGDWVRVGVSCTTMPGTIIGNRCIIGPATLVKGNLEDDMIMYTSFDTVIKERDYTK